MGSWNGDDYREVPTDGDPTEFNTVQRRAYLFERVNEEGHPSLIDEQKEAKKLDISKRQVYYDMEAVAEFLEETAGANHVGENIKVFEKAKRELLQQGDFEGAVDVLKDQAEWLADRGAIDREPEQQEVTWREALEEDD